MLSYYMSTLSIFRIMSFQYRVCYFTLTQSLNGRLSYHLLRGSVGQLIKINIPSRFMRVLVHLLGSLGQDLNLGFGSVLPADWCGMGMLGELTWT